MSLHVVILAAGQGSRMKSKLPKVLHAVAGKPMLQHVLDTASELQPDAIHVIVGHGADLVKTTINTNVNWCLQEEQLGTGHAVAQALPHVPDDATVLILYGDVPLTSKQTLGELVTLVDDKQLGLLTVELEDPSGYGRIIRDADGFIESIVEQKDANEEQLGVNEVNTGILALRANLLHEYLPKLSNSNAQGEYYLTDIVEMATSNDLIVEAHHPRFEQEVQGVNNRLQLCELECWYQSMISEQLMLSGVTLFDPNRIDVRGKLTCGQDVEIDLNCIFEGDVTIEDNVKIGPNCVIKNTTIGKGTTIYANCVIEDSAVADDCNIGPFARLRPGSQFLKGSKAGNFVETKKSLIGEGSKVNHLSYIGDAELGQKVNVGAGTITCNYDGVNKFKTEIGDEVFVGSNTSLVAPVKIGCKATVGAGSTITKEIESEQLAIARNKQKNIDGWQRPIKNQ